MGLLFLSVAGLASVAELLYTGKPSASLLVLLFIILKVQADRSAYLFMKYGKTGKAPPPPWYKAPEAGEFVKPDSEEEAEPVDETVHVDSLGGKRKGHSHHGPRPDPAPSSAEPLRLSAPLKAGAQAKAHAGKPRPSPEAPRAPKRGKPREWPSLFRLPRFNGKPHEVLGLGIDPTTRQIIGAFRHWIKRHHPDHAQNPQDASRATDEARRLNEAKQALLDRRKQRRAPPAA